MCMRCEEAARKAIEEGISLLAHDASTLTPGIRAEIEEGELDGIDLDNFFLQAAIARLAMGLAMRTHQPPFIVLGELAGSMMAAQMETEAVNEFIQSTGLSMN